MLYEYDCPEHGRFETLRRVAERDIPVSCPDCGLESARAFSIPSIKVIKKERLPLGNGSMGKVLTKKDTGGLDIFIPSYGLMEQAEVDYIAEGAIEKEKERVKINKQGPRNDNQARLQAYSNLALRAPKGQRHKVLQEAMKEAGDKITVSNIPQGR